MTIDREEMVHYALAASATVNGVAVLFLTLNLILRAYHKHKYAIATAAIPRPNTLPSETDRQREKVQSAVKRQVTMNNLLSTLASRNSKSTTDNKGITYGEVYTDPGETTAVVNMPATEALWEASRPGDREVSRGVVPSWQTVDEACATTQQGGRGSNDSRKVPAANVTVNPWQGPPPSYAQATRMTGQQKTSDTRSLVEQTQQRQEHTTSCSVDGSTAATTIPATSTAAATRLRLPADHSDDKSKQQAQMVIELLMHVYAGVSGGYIIFTSGVLHYIDTASTSTPRRQDNSDVTSLTILSVYAGMVAYRLMLNITVRLPTSPRERGTVFLRVAYDTVLGITLGLIVYGGRLDMLGGIIVFCECATLFAKINRPKPLPITLTSYATSVPLLSPSVSKQYSTAIVISSSTGSNHSPQNKYTKTSRLRTSFDSWMTSTRRHCRAIGEVTAMFICRLLIPGILLLVHITHYSLFSQTQLQLCIFAYSITFFGAFHIFALWQNLTKLKKHFLAYST